MTNSAAAVGVTTPDTTTATTTTGQVPAANASAQTATTTGTPATTGAQADWTSGLNDEMKGYLQNKGFKDPQAVLESYRNYEKLQGVPQDRLLKMPENMDTPEGRAIWEKLGRPKDAKDYSLTVPDEAGGQEAADWFRAIADKGNFTQKQLDTLVGDYVAQELAEKKTAADAAQAKLISANDNLKKEWGLAYEHNKLLADEGARAIGATDEDLKALGQIMGPDKAMILLHKIAGATGEATFVSGQSANAGVLSPDMAKNKINELSNDEGFRKRLLSGDQDAKKQWDNVNKMAWTGYTSL